MPPLLARAVAEQIVQVLGVQPEMPSTVIERPSTELLMFDMKQAAQYYQVPATVIAQRTRPNAFQNRSGISA